MSPNRMLNAALPAAALAIIACLPAPPAEAAQGRHAAAAAGAVGGLALGAALGAAASQPRVITSPGGMVYEDRAPLMAEDDCTVVRHRVFVPGYGWRIRREEVCD